MERNQDLEKITEISINALRKVYQTHKKLGSAGRELVRKNQFGETALKADIEAEREIIKALRKIKFPIRIISEEHGIVNLAENPIYLGIFDGLDGTNRYKAFVEGDKRARYGTMFAIFQGLSPNYEDYIVSTIMEHSTDRLFASSKKRGAFFLDLNSDSSHPIKVSGKKEFDKDTRILIDNYEEAKHFDFIMRILVNRLPKGFDFRCLRSSAAHYVDLASGKADLVLECTRKENLEIAVAYGLIKEAGGTMITLEGEGLGEEKYLEFGQDRYTPVISAASLLNKLCPKIP